MFNYMPILFVVAVTAFVAGYKYSEQQQKLSLLDQEINIYHEGRKVSENVQNLSNYKLCLQLGGLRDACQALNPGENSKSNSAHSTPTKNK